MINVRMQHKEVKKLTPKITVIGVGGAGGNAVNNMISSDLQGVEFLVCNTDAQALEGSYCENKIQLGAELTGGLGAGAKPEIGCAAAEETLEEVMSYLEGSNMAFITAGMGGGTGTGAAPVIAKACRERGILTVGVVTKPFHFEGTLRMRMADDGIEQMQGYVDTLIVIPNQNLFRVANEKTTFTEAFRLADSVLQSGVRGVTDLMVMPGLINLDFADIRSAMLEMGKAMMGTGEAEGERRSIEAAEAAINNPLLDDVTMKGARGVIINVTGGTDMTLFEVDEACNRIRDEVDVNANIIFGSTFDDRLDGMMRVSIVATGIDVESQSQGVTGGGRPSISAYGRDTSGDKTIERARPNTINEATIAQADAGTAAQALAQSVNVGSSLPKSPISQESDMFESKAPAMNAASLSNAVPAKSSLDISVSSSDVSSAQPAGTIYNDAFIPPAPVTVNRQFETGSYTAQPVMSAPQPYVSEPEVQPEQPAQAAMAQTQSAAPTLPLQAQSPRTAEASTVSSSGLKLNPPVPGGNREVKRKPASLFERFTNPLRSHDREEEETGSSEGGNASSGGGVSRSLRAPQRPEQGSLNIDAPKLKDQEDSGSNELDIPAFLRRQAN